MRFNQKLSGFVPATTPTRTGYRFRGWFSDEGCNAQVCFTQAEFNSSKEANKELLERMPSNNLTVYAGWEELTFPVTYFPNLGDRILL